MKKILNKKFYIIFSLFLFSFCFISFLLFQNTNIKVSNINYINEKIPNSFNNYKICHITDLHDANFGKEQSKLIEIVESGNPDIIVITGDLIDSNRYDLKSSLNFVEKAVLISPVYYVSGNHEYTSGYYEDIILQLENLGVITLEEKLVTLNKDNETINLLGVKDPNVIFSSIDNTLNLLSDDNEFQILLSHRPELFETYCNHNIDLVFTGHAHGGQVRLPFIGGLIAPHQGLFPKYTAGMYTEGSTSMYVSRGLGNSVVPLRVFNNPEVVFLTLNNF